MSDSQKRAVYDQYGEEGLKGGIPGAGGPGGPAGGFGGGAGGFHPGGFSFSSNMHGFQPSNAEGIKLFVTFLALTPKRHLSHVHVE